MLTESVGASLRGLALDPDDDGLLPGLSRGGGGGGGHSCRRHGGENRGEIRSLGAAGPSLSAPRLHDSRAPPLVESPPTAPEVVALPGREGFGEQMQQPPPVRDELRLY